MTETLAQILTKIREHRTCSLPNLHRYIRALGISPVGARQRPQRYPAGTADKILEHLGFSGAETATDASTDRRVSVYEAPETRIVSMKELRAERARAQATRRAKA